MSEAWNIYENSIKDSGIPDPGFEFSELLTVAVNLVTVIGFGISFIMLAYSFIQFVVSTGDPKRTQKAQQAMMWSIIGMLVISLLQGIKYLIKDFLGVQEGPYL